MQRPRNKGPAGHIWQESPLVYTGLKRPLQIWVGEVFKDGLENGNVIMEPRILERFRKSGPIKLADGRVWGGVVMHIIFKRMPDAMLFKLTWW